MLLHRFKIKDIQKSYSLKRNSLFSKKIFLNCSNTV